MADLTTLKSQDAQARQSLQGQRDLISQNQSQANEQLSKLNKAQTLLPNQNSQLSLRQRLSGLMGQIKRNVIVKTKQSIENQKQNIQNYKQNLNDYNQQLTNYETQQLQPFEAQIKNYEDYQAGYKAELNGAPVLSLIDASSSFKSGYLDAQNNEAAQQFDIALKKFDTSGASSLTNKEQSLINNALNNGTLQFKDNGGGTINDIKSIKDYNKYINSLKENQPVQAPTFSSTTTSPSSSNDSVGNPYQVSNFSDALNVKPFASVAAADLNTPITGVVQPATKITDTPNLFLSTVGNFFTGLTGGGSAGQSTGLKGGTISPYNPSDFISKVNAPQPSLFASVAAAQLNPNDVVSSVKDFASSVNAQTSAESALGIGNVGSYGYTDSTGNPRIEQVKEFGVPLTSISNYNGLKSQISTDIPKLNDLDTRLNSLNSQNTNSLGQWIGTEKDYNTYQKLSNERQNLYNQINNNQVAYNQQKNGLGLFGQALADFNYAYPISSTANLISSGVGQGFNYLNPGKAGEKIIYYTPTSGTQEYDLLTGKPLPYFRPTETVTTASDIGGLGEFTKTAALGGLYATPILGTTLAGGDVLESLGNYNFSPSEFITKSSPSEKLQLGLDVAYLGVPALGKGAEIILNNVPAAKIQYTKFLEKAGADLKSLDNSEVKWISFESLPDGQVRLKGIQSVGGLTKNIDFIGKLSKSELNKVVLNGVGEYKTTGLTFFSPKEGQIPKSYGLNEFGTFESGSQGQTFPLGKIGDIQVFGQLGEGTTIPKTSTFAAFEIKPGTEDKILKSILKQSKRNFNLGGPISKEVSSKKVFKFNDNLFLTSGKNDVGVTIRGKNQGAIFDLAKGGSLEILPLEEKGSKIFSSKKTSFDKTFGPLVTETKNVNILRTPEVPKSSTLKSPKIVKNPVQSNLLSGLPFGGSAFEGKGLYEQTQSQKFSPNILSPKLQKDLVSGPIVKVGALEIGKQTQSQKSGLDYKQHYKNDILTIPRVGTKSYVGTAVKSRQDILTKQVTSNSQKQNPSSKSQTTFNPLIKRPPVKNPPKIKVPSTSEKTKKKLFYLSPKKGEGFLAITKRKGKEVVLGITKTPQSAKAIAERNALGTLGATVKVKTTSGRELKLNPNGAFRTSKTDPLALVQRERTSSGGRLSSKSERFAIVQSRKKTGVLSLK